MHVTSKGQVTILQSVRDSMGIIPAESDVDFIQDKPTDEKSSRFRTAHQSANITMSTDEIMTLTRE